jgi:hypothetical protein
MFDSVLFDLSLNIGCLFHVLVLFLYSKEYKGFLRGIINMTVVLSKMRTFYHYIINQPFVQSCIVNIFVSYCNVIGIISRKSRQLYDKYPVIKNTIKKTQYLSSIILKKSVEPIDEYWICVSNIQRKYKRDGSVEYQYTEMYDNIIKSNKLDIVKINISKKTIFDYYKEWYKTTKDVILLESAAVESIVTLKYENKYIHRICNKTINQIQNDLTENNDLSNVKFLSIEYIPITNTNTDDPIILTLEKGHYLVGNEILSTAFVKRLLHYQYPYSNFVFDMNYKLRIIDHNVSAFQLTSYQYIVLTGDNYIIREQE